jgi:hypothetical protein
MKFKATDFASNFFDQVLDVFHVDQVGSNAQVWLLLQHDPKEPRYWRPVTNIQAQLYIYNLLGTH